MLNRFNGKYSMLKRLETSLITTGFIVITAIILIIYSKQREQEFKAYNISTQETIVNGAAYAINMKLLDKRRNVQLFVNEYARHLNQLALTPNNEKFVDNIKIRLQQRFQDYFTYTITNKQGIPKLDNMDELVGQVCQVDIKNYAKNLSKNNSGKLQNKVIIHPQPFNYHYDKKKLLSTRSFFEDIKLCGNLSNIKSE